MAIHFMSIVVQETTPLYGNVSVSIRNAKQKQCEIETTQVIRALGTHCHHLEILTV